MGFFPFFKIYVGNLKSIVLKKNFPCPENDYKNQGLDPCLNYFF